MSLTERQTYLSACSNIGRDMPPELALAKAGACPARSGLFAAKQIDKPEHYRDQEEDDEDLDAETEQNRTDSQQEAQ